MTGKKKNETAYVVGIGTIAEYLGKRLGCTVSISSVHRWIKNRQLPVKRKGGWTIAAQQELDEWIDSDL